MGKPGGLPSMGLHRVGHDWSDLAAAAAAAMVLRIKNIGTYVTHLPFLTKMISKAFSISKAQGLLIDTEWNYTMCYPLNMCETTTFQLVLMKLCLCMASLVAQTVKHLPAMQETWVQSLSWEDPLENKMATHDSILAWRILRTEELGGLQSMKSQRVGHDSASSLHWQFIA